MKINQLKAGVILSYLTELVCVISGIVYTPVMLRLLGKSEYGLYQLVNSVVSYLSLLSLSFGSGYLRFYSKYKAKEDNTSVKKLNGMFLIVFSIVSIICIFCGVVMIHNARAILGPELTGAELSKAKVLMGLLVLGMVFSFLGSVFNCFVTANEMFFFQRLLNFLRALLNPFITLPLLIMGFGSIAMVMVSVGLSIAAFCANLSFCIKKLKMEFTFKGLKFSLLKEIWIFTSFIFINTIVDQINWSIDKVLIGRELGTAAVAVYGVAASLNSMYISFSTAISSVFVPKVNMIVAQKNNSLLDHLFAKVGRLQFIIVWLVMSGYILFGKEFIEFWAGEGYEKAYYVGLLLMVPVTVPLIQNIGIEIQRAKNMHKARSIVYLIMALINIGITILFMKKWGIIGAAAGTALALVLCNGVFMNIYYHKKIGLDIRKFWQEILAFLPTILVLIVIGVLLNKLITLDNLLGLIIKIVIYTGLYCLGMFLFGMNDSEKENIILPFKKVFGVLWKK